MASLRPRSLVLAVVLEGGLLGAAAFLPTGAGARAPLRLEIACEMSDASEAIPEREQEEREEIREPEPTPTPPELPPEDAPDAGIFDPPQSEVVAEPLDRQDLRDPLERHALAPLRRAAPAKAPREPEPRERVAKSEPEPAPPAAPASKPSLPELVQGHNAPPVYPRRARKLAHEGTVELEIRVDASGLVVDVRVKRSSGSGLLDRAAVRAARGWRYDRGPASFPWKIEFRLDAGA